MLATAALLAGCGCTNAGTATESNAAAADSVATVYMFTEISPDNLVKIYDALGRKATGNVAVKLSTGEPGGHNFLQPSLIKDLVHEVNGTIVECNTAYGGGRSDTESHYKAAQDHGFTDIATVDIMDAEGEVASTSTATSLAHTTPVTISPWYCRTSRDMQWQGLAEPSRTSR